ncbi:aldo-keto reductase family 1 member B1-like [Anthonomus grandis grandis]|uniref:aldo-keto reductase family 1 member B1-like n=1 Tax=Anthonomus grandis grandis TaxID=2921223 RepID=UPI0021656D5E|nr:aldo-keto reductase family 1 member B1-like [Anthonomus grandis grandis]
MVQVPLIQLNNGITMPVIGLGTWRAPPGEVYKAVQDAIDSGFRHFDCAMLYGNEDEIGQALHDKLKQGTIKREDLFIVSKVWCNSMRPDLVEPTLKKTLKSLRLDYLDQYLTHWPMGFQESDSFYPLGEDGKLQHSDVDYVDSWKAMEEVYRKGLTRSIGISNYNPAQVQRLMKTVSIKPVVNQIEVHPYLIPQDWLDVCKTHDIVVVAYSPLGSNDRPWATKDDPRVLEDPVIMAIAKKHKKTTAQVTLRFLVQLGLVPIPKSSNPKRIKENLEIFDFELTSEEMSEIRALHRNIRYHKHVEALGHRHYPF